MTSADSISAAADVTASEASRLSIFSGIFYPCDNAEFLMDAGALSRVCVDLILGVPVTYEHLGVCGSALACGEARFENGLNSAGERYAPAGILGRTIAGYPCLDGSWRVLFYTTVPGIILSGVVHELSLTHSLLTGRGLEISLTRDAARVGSIIEAVHDGLSKGYNYMRKHMSGTIGEIDTMSDTMSDTTSDKVDLKKIVDNIENETDRQHLQDRLAAIVNACDRTQAELRDANKAKDEVLKELETYKKSIEEKDIELQKAMAESAKASDLVKGQEAAEKIYQQMLGELSANLRNCGVTTDGLEGLDKNGVDLKTNFPLVVACNKAFSKMLGEDTMRKRRAVSAPEDNVTPVLSGASALEKALGDTFEIL